MPKARILIIDDELSLLDAACQTLRLNDYAVSAFGTAHAGIEAVRKERFDVALIDLRLPEMDGIDILREVRSVDMGVVVVMITGFPTIDTAVAAIRQGAFDYLPKPFSPDQLLITLDRAIRHKRLAEENRALRETLRAHREFNTIIGRSKAMERVLDQVSRVADTDASVVIEGETGTGKELIARSLHDAGTRKDKPFLPINCGALPENLLESELFGHERGAFSGAVSRKQGLLEIADGGTVFLDEISNLALGLQAKLLRVLQDFSIRRVGGTETLDVDLRVISATNENLERKVEDGSFRQDLFYRLNVITIRVPPLRERPEDIPVLAEHFLDALRAQHGRAVEGYTRDAMDALLAHRWPGNVRELKNAVERAFFLTDSAIIPRPDLPDAVARPSGARPTVNTRKPYKESRREFLEPFEREYLARLLEETGGNVSRAAERSGLHRSSIQRLLSRHGLTSDAFRE